MRLLVIAITALTLAASASAAAGATADTPCPVTTPNGQTYVGESGGGNHGNDYLVTGLWPRGVVEFIEDGPGYVYEDGALGMKFWWWRRAAGSLTIEGRRLDAPAGPLRARVPGGYGRSRAGFQPVRLIFPTPGCWEVTGHVGSGSLTFVTLVRKLGNPRSFKAGQIQR